MIGQKMQTAMNKQIQREIDSAYLYLSMAAYFESQNLNGMAHWMKVQAKEEMGHAMKLYEHIYDRGGRVKLFAIEEPKHEWASPLEAFQAAHKHEQFISSKIHELVELAETEKDKAAMPTLQWFVAEQIEEEASPLKIVQMLERIGASGNGLIMLDVQLGKREG